MNTSNMRRPSGPECARYASFLPQFRQGTLSPANDTALRAHLVTCAYCQAQLATYDRLDAALHTYIDHFAPTAPSADDLVRAAVARVSSAPLDAADNHRLPSLGVRQKDREMFDSQGDSTIPPTLPPAPAYGRPPHNTRQRPVLATIAALLLIGLAAAIFAMFTRANGGPASHGSPTATAQPTLSAQSTATAQATATPVPTQSNSAVAVDSGHPCSTDTSGQTSYVQLGELKVSKVNFALSYPANALPANLDPSKPYQLPDNLPNPPNPPVNPQPNYSFTVCNTSHTARYVISGVTVRIAGFTPYSGPLNTYQFCDTFYQRPNGPNGGGCGGGMTLDERLQASFAANATTGAQVTAAQTGTGSPDMPPLPVRLGPGQQLIFVVAVTLPTQPGTYTFAFGLSYDSVTAAPISTMQPALFDNAAVKWNGSNCTTSAMLSQIPTSSTAKYVCAS